jgi:hypothetical protein
VTSSDSVPPIGLKSVGALHPEGSATLDDLSRYLILSSILSVSCTTHSRRVCDMRQKTLKSGEPDWQCDLRDGWLEPTNTRREETQRRMGIPIYATKRFSTEAIVFVQLPAKVGEIVYKYFGSGSVSVSRTRDVGNRHSRMRLPIYATDGSSRSMRVCINTGI